MGVNDQIDADIRRMRNLLYCGEWIESHVLHMFLLHLPDFLGYESAISMAADHGPLLRRALGVKKVGNQLVALLGGRSVHPVGACVGGFYSLPEPRQMAVLLAPLDEALEDMEELALFLVQKVQYPDHECDYEFVALQPAHEYPMNLGPIVSSKGLRVEQEDFLQAIEERQEPHSNALHAVIRGRGAYHVGPLARLNLNADRLHPRAKAMLQKACAALQRDLPWRSSYLSLPARAIETIHALALASEIAHAYRPAHRARICVEPRAGIGAAATEAPRGVLFHQYRTDAAGAILGARIIPPTAQNQFQIEQDLWAWARRQTGLSDEQACLGCEQLIRNYDPRISCAVHCRRVTHQVCRGL